MADALYPVVSDIAGLYRMGAPGERLVPATPGAVEGSCRMPKLRAYTEDAYLNALMSLVFADDAVRVAYDDDHVRGPSAGDWVRLNAPAPGAWLTPDPPPALSQRDAWYVERSAPPHWRAARGMPEFVCSEDVRFTALEQTFIDEVCWIGTAGQVSSLRPDTRLEGGALVLFLPSRLPPHVINHELELVPLEILLAQAHRDAQVIESDARRLGDRGYDLEQLGAGSAAHVHYLLDLLRHCHRLVKPSRQDSAAERLAWFWGLVRACARSFSEFDAGWHADGAALQSQLWELIWRAAVAKNTSSQAPELAWAS